MRDPGTDTYDMLGGLAQPAIIERIDEYLRKDDGHIWDQMKLYRLILDAKKEIERRK